jgi:threo-3-hydroxy-L-aspartate ammonia-lyase
MAPTFPGTQVPGAAAVPPSAPGPYPLTVIEVFAAAERLKGIVHETPVQTSHTLDERTGASVFLKCENFQRTGAFKIRGAYNALSQLGPDERKAGVITYSSGNHAQAVALAGKLLGIKTVVVMPSNAPTVKATATRAYGAEVIQYDPQTDDREALAERIRRERGMVLIPPYDHPHVIAGQGTAAYELIQATGQLDLVLAPCGGGGLLSGTALVTRALLKNAQVMGVEPEGANNGTLAFKEGRIVRVEHPETMADGLMPKAVGEWTFAMIRQHVTGMVTVTEEEIRSTLDFLWNRMKLLVEPSGAAALAPVLHGKIPVSGKRIGVILSGGNADIGKVADWLRASQA